MTTLSRRRFLLRSAGVPFTLAASLSACRVDFTETLDMPDAPPGEGWLRLGVTDWDLLGIHYLEHSTPRPEAVELAARLGFEGLEINLGRTPDSLPMTDPELRERFREESRRHRLPIPSTCLDILHQNYLKSDPLGQRWVAESIPVTRDLGARVILLPFFGDGALETRREMDFVADFLREIAPEAERAQVVLGIENMLPASDNAYIVERVDSPAVRVYYDVGNSTSMAYDLIEEITWLGAERICQFHVKDNPHYLGEGEIDFPSVMRTIQEIGFRGWGMLETSSPSGDVVADMETNLEYIRGVRSEAGMEPPRA
jgi:L-ribulose-5-phosphate 3-epimerase